MDLDPALVRQLALGIVPPGLAGTLLFALTLRKPDAGRPGGTLLAQIIPLLLGGLYCGMHALVLGLRVPPRESTDWLPIGGVVAAIAASLVGAREQRVSITGWLWRVVALGVVGVVAAGRIRGNWEAGEGVLLVGGFVLAAAVALVGSEIVVRRRNAALAAFVLLVFAAGASQVLVLGFSSLKLSQSAGLWAAMLGGAWLVGLVRRGAWLPVGVALVVVSATIAAMFQGALYTSTARPWLLIALVAVTPVLAAAGTLLRMPEKGRARHLRWIVPLALSLVPIGAAMAISMPDDKAADEAEYEYEY